LEEKYEALLYRIHQKDNKSLKITYIPKYQKVCNITVGLKGTSFFTAYF